MRRKFKGILRIRLSDWRSRKELMAFIKDQQLSGHKFMMKMSLWEDDPCLFYIVAGPGSYFTIKDIFYYEKKNYLKD
jgi:hypothetical protein